MVLGGLLALIFFNLMGLYYMHTCNLCLYFHHHFEVQNKKINVKRTNRHADSDTYLLFLLQTFKVSLFLLLTLLVFCGILILVDSHLRL